MNGDRYRILVVDDEQDIRQILSMTLREDYEVVVAKNGLDAMFKMTRYEPDLVMIDVMMPLMDGLELGRKIRETPGYQDTPLVFLSALNTNEDIKNGYRAGADVYLTKPFEADRVMKNLSVSLQDRPVRSKKLSIEEVLERERRAEEKLQRALEKKPAARPPRPGTEEEDYDSEVEFESAEGSEPEEDLQALDALFDEEEAPPQTARARRGPRRLSPERRARLNQTPQPAPESPPQQASPAQRSEIRARHEAAKRGGRPLTGAELKEYVERESQWKDEIEERVQEDGLEGVTVSLPRILVVDDDHEFHTFARLALEEDYEVVCADNGVDALGKIASLQPDIYLIDGMMPKMSGFQLVDALRSTAETHGQPIIFATARDSAHDRRAVMRKGIRHFLVKPFGTQELLNILTTITTDPKFKIRKKKRPIEDILKEEEAREGEHHDKERKRAHKRSRSALEEFIRTYGDQDPFGRGD